jgi:hypothetical protein
MRRHSRHLLVPTWIKSCSWILLVLGIIELATLPNKLIENATVVYSIGDLKLTRPAQSAPMLAISTGWIVYASVAFALLWGKHQGRILGLVAGYLSIIIGVALVLIEPGFFLCLVFVLPLLQIPFVLAMHDLANTWCSHAEANLPTAQCRTPAPR